MKRRRFLGLGAGLAASTAIAQVKPQGRLPRLGVVAVTASVAQFRTGNRGYGVWPSIEGGLRKRGWIEGQNLEIHIRSLDGDDSKAESVVQELISMPVDIIMPNGSAIPAAYRLTRTIPIVSDVPGTRVDSSDRLPPNATGINFVPSDAPLEPKMLALLKEIKPLISRVAFVGNPRNPAFLAESEVVMAGRMGITLSVTNLKSIHRPEADLDEALRQGAEGLLIYPAPGLQVPEGQRPIHEWARRHRIPVIHNFLSAADTGGLMALAIDRNVIGDRLAYFADRILRGAQPKDLPVEDAGDLQLVINLGAAKAIGLEVPPSLRLQATRLIQ